MDKTTQNLAATPEGRSALVLAEVQKLPGGCGGEDPEDPRCAKVTVIGSTRPVPPEGVDQAMGMLVARHPVMGGLHIVSAEDYFAADLAPAPSTAAAAA
ncbi:hypothetical protein MNEG_8008 [Monoraphidium neglectum]|uniref:CREG-like beta-barrel domain-containing protein n=1 Tax=Monoraphidium neglectum TaxID=145388 RepID=A0A0D2KXB8_9CHLO|nr:hypothetical protein MNEG_8008 [Monoraphidium neglectum]KIY99953.1 hypothetical protein MNEG_8008 [Monoraphidium neglectum]|eukprot:XP_013898973.1 hypothetical protein MNEG_8008 [Monoraphidium neglectum]